MLSSSRNQSFDLRCKSFDWFLYESNIAIKKVNTKVYVTAKLYIKLQNGYVGPFLTMKTVKH